MNNIRYLRNKLIVMQVALLKERLHQYIDSADDQHLAEMVAIMDDEDFPETSEPYDQATMTMLYKRRDDHRNGVSISLSVEESLALVRKSAL